MKRPRADCRIKEAAYAFLCPEAPVSAGDLVRRPPPTGRVAGFRTSLYRCVGRLAGNDTPAAFLEVVDVGVPPGHGLAGVRDVSRRDDDLVAHRHRAVPADEGRLTMSLERRIL